MASDTEFPRAVSDRAPARLLLPLEAQTKRKNFAMKQPTNALPNRVTSRHLVVALLEQFTHAASAANQLRRILATLEESDRRVGNPR